MISFSFPRLRQLAPPLVVLASAVVAIIAFWQTLNYSFNADDDIYVTNNIKLAGLHLTELWRLFIEPYNIYEFLPLRDLSYWFDITLFGLSPSVFRLHNILLYLLCLPLVYGVSLKLWRYFRPSEAASAAWAAAAVTALFALHPAHVESVVWISGRKDVLSSMFSLLALWFAVSARRKHGLSAPYAAAALAALLAAMFSKATSVAVAPVISLLWIVLWRDTPLLGRRYSQLLWPLASLLLATYVALVFTTSSTVKIPAYFEVGVITRALAILGWLARLAVSPESRHFFYPVLEDPYLPVMVITGMVILAAAIIGIVMTMRRRSLEGFALVTFSLLCIPYIQLAPYLTPSLVADRWLALAVWPVVLLIVALSWRLKPTPRTILLLAFALPMGFQTLVRPYDWRNFNVLIDKDSRAYPWFDIPAMYRIVSNQLPVSDALETANSIANTKLRNFMFKLINAEHAVYIEAVATGKPQNAITQLWEWGLDLQQPPEQAKSNPAILTFWIYCQDILLSDWMFLAKNFPEDALVRYNAGLYMLKVNRYEEAADHLRAANESQRLPGSMRGTAFKNLGLALLRGGHIAEAEAPLHTALEQAQPDLQAYCLLSEVYAKTKRFEEAARSEADCRSRAPGEKAVP